MYRFRIKDAANGQVRVHFTYNAEPMVWSENYASKAGATNCVSSIKLHAATAPIVDVSAGESGSGYRFEIVKAINGQHFVRFVAANGQTLVWSETYTTKQNANNCARSVKLNAKDAAVFDETRTYVA